MLTDCARSWVSWCQTKEMMEIEFDDAKLVAAQTTAQSSCILLKFEEIELLEDGK
ncbi:hypothetical protein ACFX13_035438 [Malus domestica]